MMKSKITGSDWSKLSSTSFEEMVFWILHREGFYNVSWYGQPGGDKGRDIVAERTLLMGPKVLSCSCVVQCKKYKGRVSRHKIYEDILKASEFNPDFFILVTSGIVNASTKDWLASHEGRFGMKIIVWERTDLEILLERHQDLRYEFLGVAPRARFFLGQLADQDRHFVDIDNINLTRTLEVLLKDACDKALERHNLLTIGHLLCSFLKGDRKCARLVFLKNGIDPDMLCDIVENNLVGNQPEVPLRSVGWKSSVSFRSTLKTGIRLMSLVNEPALSERIVFLAILLQAYSATVIFLERPCRINREDIIDSLLNDFFDDDEMQALRGRYGERWAADEATYTRHSSLLEEPSLLTRYLTSEESEELRQRIAEIENEAGG